jgi:hypothetical protein
MFKDAMNKTVRDCEVCGIGHDEGIHEATLSVHEWFRHQVTRYLHETGEEATTQVA